MKVIHSFQIFSKLSELGLLSGSCALSLPQILISPIISSMIKGLASAFLSSELIIRKGTLSSRGFKSPSQCTNACINRIIPSLMSLLWNFEAINRNPFNVILCPTSIDYSIEQYSIVISFCHILLHFTFLPLMIFLALILSSNFIHFISFQELQLLDKFCYARATLLIWNTLMANFYSRFVNE